MATKKVGVLMGGPSAEREISLRTGKGVLDALRSKGHDAIELRWDDSADPCALVRSAGVVWIALHGTHGEDGCIQGLLECLKVPYTGSGVTASALAMDKVLSKRIFDDQEIPTPAWKVLERDADPREAGKPFGVPVVVKPAREGSTVGVTVVRRESELDAAVALARKCHGETLVERYIAGKELSVAILDGAVLGTVEIRPKVSVYDYEAKYERGDTEYLVPAPLDPKVDDAVKTSALAAYRALGCCAHARVDVRLDEEGKGWVLEVNTLPGMTGTSLLPKIAAKRGMDYATLCEKILASAGLRA
jgi:D-alanine-D-alanine ligase